MLSVKHLHFSLRNHIILKDLSFTLQPGEIVGFVGNNGAGKTTTLEILSTCLQPTSGSITWRGELIEDSMNYRRAMGYVPDQLPLYPNATVSENLQFTAELRSVEHPRQRVQTLLSEFGLQTVAATPLRTLSKGWTQWVGIAQAWCHRPQLLLLDEPTSGLDPSGRQRFEDWLRHIRSEGHTVFFSSHILSEVEAVSDRILWIETGRLRDETERWTMLCRLEAPSESLVSVLESMDGISDIHLIEDRVVFACNPSQRASIARSLINFGLLEMRRIR